jgi:hypothetical protein
MGRSYTRRCGNDKNSINMRFENPESGPESNENTEKKVSALKAILALTSGLLFSKAETKKEEGFLKAVVENTKETYSVLDDLEKKIDPGGELTKKADQGILNFIQALNDKLEKKYGDPDPADWWKKGKKNDDDDDNNEQSGGRFKLN